VPLGPLLAVAFTVSQVGLPLDAYGPTAPSHTNGSGRIAVGRALSFSGIQTQRAVVRAGEIVHAEGSDRFRLRIVGAGLTLNCGPSA
jgi:hypothetical protein